MVLQSHMLVSKTKRLAQKLPVPVKVVHQFPALGWLQAYISSILEPLAHVFFGFALVERSYWWKKTIAHVEPSYW